MEAEFLIEGPQPEQDLSHPYVEKCDDLCYIQKGVKLKNFRANMNKRNLDCEFKVRKFCNLCQYFFKLLRRLTENQMYTNQFRDYNPEIAKLDRYNQVMPCIEIQCDILMFLISQAYNGKITSFDKRRWRD